MKQNNLVPSPLSSDHEYYRFHHIDLPDLDDTHLTDELYYLRPCLWGTPPDHWLRERVARLESELRKRRILKVEPRRPQRPAPTGIIPL